MRIRPGIKHSFPVTLAITPHITSNLVISNLITSNLLRVLDLVFRKDLLPRHKVDMLKPTAFLDLAPVPFHCRFKPVLHGTLRGPTHLFMHAMLKEPVVAGRSSARMLRSRRVKNHFWLFVSRITRFRRRVKVHWFWRRP
jgi:hypothetical protein